MWLWLMRIPTQYKLIMPKFSKCQTGPPLKSTIKRRLETPPWPSLRSENEIMFYRQTSMEVSRLPSSTLKEQLNTFLTSWTTTMEGRSKGQFSAWRRGWEPACQNLVALLKAGGCDYVLKVTKIKSKRNLNVFTIHWTDSLNWIWTESLMNWIFGEAQSGT